MKASEKFAHNMKMLREKQGYSKTKLATLVNVHRTYIALIENGSRIPTLDVAFRIAYALQTNLKDML